MKLIVGSDKDMNIIKMIKPTTKTVYIKESFKLSPERKTKGHGGRLGSLERLYYLTVPNGEGKRRGLGKSNYFSK